MRFYIGLHRLTQARHFQHAFISANILRKRKSDFAVNSWIMDSGAFTEISTHGRYRTSVKDYADQINRWASCGNLEMAVTQDYMCEPFILEKTGLTVAEHQRLTIERYDALCKLTKVTIMPVLQGYKLTEYLDHLKMYGARLKHNMRVGVGSICKRNTKPFEIMRILQAIKGERPDLQLHGFGLKTTSLANSYISSLLNSADSMAWSYAARREGRDSNGLSEAQAFNKKITDSTFLKMSQITLL